jgi:hypothetical protein
MCLIASSLSYFSSVESLVIETVFRVTNEVYRLRSVVWSSRLIKNVQNLF